MMPERAVSKIMRGGVAAGLIFMLLGFLASAFGGYSEKIHLTWANLLNGHLLTDGAGLMYVGTMFIIMTPLAVLLYLSMFYMFSKTKRYAVYCLAIIFVLILVVMTRV